MWEPSPGRPPTGPPARWWAGPLLTQGRGVGRRTRSSPSGGKLRTWRRGPVSQQRTSMEGQEVASVNTGDPAAALAERRVLKIQTRCGESRTAGSGSGPGKRAGSKDRTAPRTDFTTGDAHATNPTTTRSSRPE